MTEEKNRGYLIGDWIVHLNYGVGQIELQESRTIGDDEHQYYKVKTSASTFWVPVRNIDGNERIRPVSKPKDVKKALKHLKSAPEKMNASYKVRRRRIAEESTDGSLQSDIKLIRDLYAREREKGLTDTEGKALDRLRNRIIEEWSLSQGIQESEARQIINEMLIESSSKSA